MTGPDATSLRALAEAATPGPWITWAGYRHASVEAKDAEGRPYVFAQGYKSPRDDANLAFIAAANPTTVLALLDEVERLRADIAAAEQRGREDNADHGQCYVHGSKALEALLASERAERGTVDFLLAQKDEWLPEVERLRATVARVEALAGEADEDAREGFTPEARKYARLWGRDIRAALDGTP